MTWSALWIRNTWHTNRAAIPLRLPDDGRSAGERSQQLELQIDGVVGYFPLFYGRGLQVIGSGYGVGERGDQLEKFVDRADNQRSTIQRIHVVNPGARASRSARTWGQVVTGEVQDALEAGIAAALK